MAERIQSDSFGQTKLEPFVLDSLWTASTPVRFAGIWFPHVMTVVRLGDHEILLHSPCRPSTTLIKAVEDVGVVSHVVAPNWFHDLYLTDYRRLYPKAAFWGPPRLCRQLGPGVIDRDLDEAASASWSSDLQSHVVPGLLTFDESIFFHVPTKTLIVGDLFANLCARSAPAGFTRTAYRLTAIDGRLAMLPYLRWFSFTVRRSLHDAARRITQWHPERLVVGHGAPIASDAMTQLSPVLQRLS